MTDKEIQDKLGAMDLRFRDDEENYMKLLKLMEEYSELSSQYGQQVISALQNGLKNFERYLKIESALSPRSIIIKKQDFDKKQRAKGCYRVYFVMDDESVHELHSTREACHLLYILFLLYSQKNGLLADFFLQENLNWENEANPIRRVVKLIYPEKTDKEAQALAKDLASDRSFTETVQFLSGIVKKCVQDANTSDGLYWYMPYYIGLKKKHLYRMYMPQANIIYPEEFRPIIDALDDAVDFLSERGIEVNRMETDFKNDFAKWRKAAEQGDAEGLFRTGVYYGTGDIVSHDYKKSIEYFKKAEKKGHLDAIFQIGIYHQFGFGVDKDIYKALSYYERVAQRGHAEGAARAAQIYERGTDGVKEDHKKAFNLYMIAAKQDNEEAMWYVIQGYLLGQGIKKNNKKAIQWFEKAYNLGYDKIKLLFGIYLFDQGDDEVLDMAYRLFLEACNSEVPMAFWMMSKMARKGYCKTDDPLEEVKEWLIKGAELRNEYCIRDLQKSFPDIYEQHKSKWENILSIREFFIGLISKMDPSSQESFIAMVDAYRERWHEDYLREICKQLSIHKPQENGESGISQRRITIRNSKGGKFPYELVLTLANGKEVVINKINRNCMVLYILTIICSYKSGYTTKMAKSNTCRPFLKELVRLTYGKPIDNIDDYIDGYLHLAGKNENYYKQYSNKTKTEICKAIGTNDEVIYYLFDQEMVNRQFLRQMILPPEYIELPQELKDLAFRMPDALKVLNVADGQADMAEISE